MPNRFLNEEMRNSFKFPDRVYALLIDGAFEEGTLLFDAIDATQVDQWINSRKGGGPVLFREVFLNDAWVYAVQVRTSLQPRGLRQWLDGLLEDASSFIEIHLQMDPGGLVDVYANMVGQPQRAQVANFAPANRKVQQALGEAVSLDDHVLEDQEIAEMFDVNDISHVIVLDVGQGSANALIDVDGNVAVYCDVGAGVLRDSNTWPTDFTDFCYCTQAPVVLSHWHYDHFHAANKFPNLISRTWIAPNQKIGPGPQSAMVAKLTNNPNCQLAIYNGQGVIQTGDLALERCSGPTTNQNRSGLAVWVKSPDDNNSPILLPGDAGYNDVPMLVGGQTVYSFAASHHGGRTNGTPPAYPNMGFSRAALSYGRGNSYRHPLPSSMQQLRNQHWRNSSPNRTIFRTTRRSTARPRLGHILLRWPASNVSSHWCAICNSTLYPTQ
jgi:hypothetical protein